MTFQPYPNRSGFISIGIAIGCGFAVIMLLNLLPKQDNLPSIYILFLEILMAFIIMGVTIAWTVITFKLRYSINRNGIMIHWGFAQQLIPFNQIEKIISGKELSSPLEFNGVKVSGLQLGWGELLGYGKTKFYTTAALANSLLIVTPKQAYFVSPRYPSDFLHAWEVRRELGPTRQWTTEVRRNWPLNVPILADSLTWGLLGAAAVICLALFGYVSFAFPDLPRTVPLHFDALGQADRTADKAFLFLFPIVGAVLLLLNSLLGGYAYRQEKLAAYFSWGSAIVVQICLWVAVYMIIGAV